MDHGPGQAVAPADRLVHRLVRRRGHRPLRRAHRARRARGPAGRGLLLRRRRPTRRGRARGRRPARRRGALRPGGRHPRVHGHLRGPRTALGTPRGAVRVKVVIAGGGSVGTAIATDLVDRHHEVTLLEQVPATAEKLRSHLPAVTVVAADACEFASLAAADVRGADVMIAATGDDEDNLVVSWLAKQEFGVPHVISRVNNARNEWLFTESWGVDVSVSTPSLITSLVDEAVEVGAVIQLMTFAHGKMCLLEVTLDERSPTVVEDLTLDELRLPDSVRVVAVVRNETPLVPSPSMHFLVDDHVILMARADSREECSTAFVG
ncbi:MAG: hypothetical protein B7Z69_09590 [Actinobacteria bacterium 21-73-9]|nr:MAG: hypothetical protein B7Z69_09590 [Actinobacteria bacterium 21-73-9]